MTTTRLSLFSALDMLRAQPERWQARRPSWKHDIAVQYDPEFNQLRWAGADREKLVSLTGIAILATDWEVKARWVQSSLVPRRKQATPAAKPEPKPKKARGELLARKRELARKRWAEMDPAKKQEAKERIWAWARANKQTK